MKFAFVSKDLPPAWGGQPTMIYRLLSGLGPEDYCLISRRDYAPENFREAPPRRLPAKYYHLPADPQLTRGYRYGLSAVRESANVVLGVVARARRLAAIMRREACEAVVACTGDPLDPPAA